MKTKAGIIGIIFLYSLVIGCAAFGIKPSPKTPEQLAKQYLAKAQKSETKGDLVKALEQYKLLLTVDPENQLARNKSRQIGHKVEKLAETHYRGGLAYHRNGRYTLARKKFLTALRYNPEHRRAKKMLTIHMQVEQTDRYVSHTLQPKESISSLALQYYGDYQKFHLISQYNKLEDATKVRVGQQIKIPVIKEIPIMADPSEIRTDSGKTPDVESGEIITVRGFIIHTVTAEESLSGLAQKYYDDYRKFGLIAKFNDMEETDSLRIGQEIKIPKVEGVTFLATEKDKDVTEILERMDVDIPENVQIEEEITQKEPTVDQAAAYRELGIELFKQNNYADAIIELEKVLNANPDDRVAKNYLSLAYFEQGVVSFDNEDYTQAIEAFETSRTYNRNCERCETYIKKSEENFKDLHYRRGEKFFWRQKVPEALDEWELVYEIDPEYLDIDYYIKRARNIKYELDKIKKSQEENNQK